MNIEIIRVVISAMGLVVLALMWRRLRRIERRLGRVSRRQDAEAHVLHTLAEPSDGRRRRHMRSLPPPR